MRTKLIALTVSIWAFAASSLLATTISFQPPTSTATTGQVFTLSVEISGAADLYGFQFDIGFDPSVLAAISVSEGTFLATGGSTIFLPGTIDNVGGSITDNADILNGPVSGVNGDGHLLDVTFQAIGNGSSNINIFNLIALNSFGQGLTVTTSNSIVNVSGGPASVIPEPNTNLLLGSGMIVLLIFFRQRSAESAS